MTCKDRQEAELPETCSRSPVVTMLKTTFKLLAIFSVCGLLCFGLVFYKNGFYVGQYPESNRSKVIFWEAVKATQNLSAKGVEEETANGDKTFNLSTPANYSLGPCPAEPPGLVGPLRVEFNVQRTLESVRNDIGSLEMGGRYRPPDCVSKHKVSE